MSTKERRYWQAWAPLAASEGTLTAATVPGFRQLIEIAARAEKMRTQLDADGLVIQTVEGKKAHPLLSNWRQTMQRQEILLDRFRLTAQGKSLAPPPLKTEADPFENHQQRRASMRLVR